MRFGHGRLLECLQAFSFRTPLAALATDDDPFANGRPLAAAAYAADMKAKTWGGNSLEIPVPIGQPHVSSFISATAATPLNRPSQPPIVRPPSNSAKRRGFASFPAEVGHESCRSCRRHVEVGREHETLKIGPPKEATLVSAASQKVVANLNRPASGARHQNALSHSS